MSTHGVGADRFKDFWRDLCKCRLPSRGLSWRPRRAGSDDREAVAAPRANPLRRFDRLPEERTAADIEAELDAAVDVVMQVG